MGNYGDRGGAPYVKPCGWLKFAVQADKEKLKHWQVAYHGSDWEAAAQILVSGLKNPGTDAVKRKHGQAGSATKKSIYVSPAVGYAAHPVYSRFLQLEPGHWAQVVVQVRVRPGSYRVQGNTLNDKYWPA